MRSNQRLDQGLVWAWVGVIAELQCVQRISL
jgi:hypothetical protein